MDYAKEIRPDDKKRVKTGVKTPINRRPGWVPGGSVVFRRLLSCWRMVWAADGGCWPFWAPERQGGRAAAGGGGAVGGCQVSGVMACRWWPSGWPAWRLLVVCRGWLGGGDPAAICGGDSAEFKYLLTSKSAFSMVWRFSVFLLCFECVLSTFLLCSEWRRRGKRRQWPGVPEMWQAAGQAHSDGGAGGADGENGRP